MTKEDLVRELALRHPKMTKKDLATLVDEFFNIMSDALKRGEEVQLGDFGTFSLADKTMKSVMRRK
jgi:nucleoid DNA-binding protein